MRRYLYSLVLLIGASTIVWGAFGPTKALRPVRMSDDPVIVNVHGGGLTTARWYNLAAADTNAVHSQYELSSLQDTVYTFTAEESAVLDYPRNVVLTLSGTAGSVDVGNAVLTGKNITGQTITESFAFTENSLTVAAGTKAFKSISTLAVHQQDAGNVHLSVGLGTVIGLEHTNAVNGVLRDWRSGTVENAATVAVSATAIESNTIDFATDPDGTADYLALLWISPDKVITSDTR